jgi:hypothetical protein
MEYLQKHFPLSFAAIEKLMVEHGAPKRDGDDQEWRGHDAGHHLDHLSDHLKAYYEWPDSDLDPDSKMPQIIHVACRALMACEVHLGDEDHVAGVSKMIEGGGK